MAKNLKLRNIPLILMAVFIVTAMVYSATEIRASYALAAAPFFIDPPQTILTNAVVGTTFDVNVTIANVTNVGGVQFRLEWNSSLMNCTSFKEVFFHTLTPVDLWSNIWSITLKYNNTGGYAEYAQAPQDTPQAEADGYCPFNVTTTNFPPYGKLAVATLTFKVTAVPSNAATYFESNFNLPTVKVGTPITADVIPVSVSTGYYRIYGPPETTTTTISYGGTNYNVTTVTNASLVPGSMNFNKVSDTDYKLNFNLTGADGTVGYVNITIPKALMSINAGEDWNVTVNGTPATPVVTSDSTNWYLYIVTELSTKSVTIVGTIPEFTWLLIPLLMAATLVAFGLRRRKLP